MLTVFCHSKCPLLDGEVRLRNRCRFRERTAVTGQVLVLVEQEQVALARSFLSLHLNEGTEALALMWTMPSSVLDVLRVVSTDSLLLQVASALSCGIKEFRRYRRIFISLFPSYAPKLSGCALIRSWRLNSLLVKNPPRELVPKSCPATVVSYGRKVLR